MTNISIPFRPECDPNYEKVGTKLFGLIYGGDSITDVLCNLNRMNISYKYGFSKKGAFSKIDRVVDDRRLQEAKFATWDTEEYDEIFFKNIKLAGIEFEGQIGFKCATTIPLVGFAKILLDQKRMIPRYKDFVYICYVEKILFNALEEKVDRQRRLQKIPLLISLIKNSLKERGFRDSSFSEEENVSEEFEYKKLLFLQDALSGKVYNNTSKSGYQSSETYIEIFYNPLAEQDPLIKKSFSFMLGLAKPKLDTSSEIRW